MIAQSTSTNSTPTQLNIGGIVQKYLWNWQGKPLAVAYETLGEGNPVLLLPALSSVSTRGEMRDIAKRLSSQFQVVALDWPGFGESDRPPLEYRGELYQQFLEDFVGDIFHRPIAIMAAGHGAGYVMQLAHKMPQAVSRIVLSAPTWRGPLPTMGANQQVAGAVRGIVRSPILGQTLYQLNTTSSFLRTMYKGHVYAEDTLLTPDFITQKRETTQQPGARYASAAFVTGALDPVREASEFRAWFQPAPVPVMVVIGENSPPKSRSEMTAVADLPGIEKRSLPGALGLHEEYSAELVEVALPFLAAAAQ
jgi:pimeloyl-ACP methyl ester carboxylesterase